MEERTAVSPQKNSTDYTKKSKSKIPNFWWGGVYTWPRDFRWFNIHGMVRSGGIDIDWLVEHNGGSSY